VGKQNDQGNRGGQGGQGGSSEGRGFAGMSDEEQRRIAQQGGEASARKQDRDEQGQFDGSKDSGGRGGSRGQGGGGSSSDGGQGGSNR
jgi:uncharacterized protein